MTLATENSPLGSTTKFQQEYRASTRAGGKKAPKLPPTVEQAGNQGEGDLSVGMVVRVKELVVQVLPTSTPCGGTALRQQLIGLGQRQQLHIMNAERGLQIAKETCRPRWTLRCKPGWT